MTHLTKKVEVRRVNFGFESWSMINEALSLNASHFELCRCHHHFLGQLSGCSIHNNNKMISSRVRLFSESK